MLLTAISDPALSAIMKPILDGAFIEKDPDVIKYVPFGLLGIFIVRSIGIFMTMMVIQIYYQITSLLTTHKIGTKKDMKILVFSVIYYLYCC